jgi:peptidyl-prolyl cis-trans isomerase D
MPSRQLRRHAARKKGDSKETIAEHRRNTQPFLYAFSVAILVVIVVTFIGLPAARGRTGGGRRIVFGYYRGKPIEYFPGNFFAERVDVLASQLRDQTQGEKSQSDLEMEGYRVWRTAFEQTALHTAILYEADKGGLWVSDDKVDQTLITTGPYVVNGQFSEERYRGTSNTERYTIRRLFREQLIHQQYVEDFLQDPAKSPKAEEFFKSMVDEQRRFTFVSFPFADYPDSQVRQFGQENRQLFRRMKLSRILIKAGERDATEIRRKLEDRSASFEEMARAQSKDLYAEKGGDMGWRYFYDIEGDFETAAPVETIFSLEEGALSPVLKSRFGWEIYRADSASLEPDLNDPDSVSTVRDYIMRYEKGKVEDYILAQAQSFRKRVEEVGFTGATLEQSYKISLTDYFPMNYQEIYFLAPVRSMTQNLDLSSASYSEAFFLQAFRLKMNEVSDPILLDDQVVVLRLDDIRQPPPQQQDMLGDYYSFYAGQALDSDMQSALLKPDYLQDDFNQTFYKYIFTSR